MKTQEQKYINFRNAVMIIGLALLGYIVQMVAAVPFASNPMILAFFSSPVGMIVGGAIFVLVMNKAPYRGTIFLYTFVPCIMLLFMGTPYVVLVFVLGAIIAETVFLNDSTRTPAKLSIAYSIYAIFWGSGTYLPAFLQKDILIEKANAMGGAEAAALYDKLYTIPYIAIAVVLTVAGALIGVWVGSKMFKKHFLRAGI